MRTKDKTVAKTNRVLNQTRDATDEEWYQAALTVCDPVENPKKGTRKPLTMEEAKEVLTAIGFLEDPDKYRRNWHGQAPTEREIERKAT